MSTAAVDAPTSIGWDRFGIWGTTALLGVTDPAALAEARHLLDGILAEVEEAASRFRPGTEVLRLNEGAGGGPVTVSPVLLDLVAQALWAAELTAGACDPTVADALVALGYDRDFDELDEDAGPLVQPPSPAPGVGGIELDPERSTLTLPEGVHLDLGATAKARAADRAAWRIAERLSIGVLVDLGGDLSIAGAVPPGGWTVGIVESTRDEDSPIGEVVAVHGGGVASSSNAVRRWRRGDQSVHHVVDPSTGLSAPEVFRLVTVGASSCVEANALSTAALVWGEEALFELPQRSVAARLVRADGTVERVGGWPEPLPAGEDG
jgi:FAD:protein FMN transferase